MDLDSRTVARELRMTFSQFHRRAFPVPSLLPPASLLARGSVLRLLVGRFMLRSLFQHHWMVFVLWCMSSFHCRSFLRSHHTVSGCRPLLPGLRGLFFFFLLFRLLLDPRQFSKDLLPFFRSFSAPRKLHAENLF